MDNNRRNFPLPYGEHMADTPATSLNVILPSSECKKECPICCDETVEELNARAEARLRERALNLSCFVTIVLICAHIFFAYAGKVLATPDIVWAIVFAPWFGEGGFKIFQLVADAISTSRNGKAKP